MAQAILLREADVRRILTMADTVQIVERAFRELGTGAATNQPRRRIQAPGAILHLMAAGLPSQGVFGHKVYATARGGARFWVHLFGLDGQALAIVEADWLGRMRTGAASGVATRYLARRDARTLGVFGSGKQALTQVMAIHEVRPLARALVFSRNPEHREAFAAQARAALGIDVVAVAAPEEAAKDPDILVTITSAREPVVRGSWLRAGQHLNVAGSNWPTNREIDEEAVQRAALVAVDDLETARLESGDLLQAERAGALDFGSVVTLAAVVGGTARRPTPEAITLFKSHGVALEDIAVAAHVLQQARATGLGEPLPL